MGEAGLISEITYGVPTSFEAGVELEKHQRACGYLTVEVEDEKGYCPAAHKVRHDLDTDESVKKMMDICGPPGMAD